MFKVLALVAVLVYLAKLMLQMNQLFLLLTLLHYYFTSRHTWQSWSTLPR